MRCDGYKNYIFGVYIYIHTYSWRFQLLIYNLKILQNNYNFLILIEFSCIELRLFEGCIALAHFKSINRTMIENWEIVKIIIITVIIITIYNKRYCGF